MTLGTIRAVRVLVGVSAVVMAFGSAAWGETVRYGMAVDDYVQLTIDGVLRASYDSAGGGLVYTDNLTLSNGWHDVQLTYRNRWDSNYLELRQVSGNGTETTVPKSSLRGLNAQGTYIQGLRADYYSLDGSFVTTVCGEGPIAHGWEQGNPCCHYQGVSQTLWAGIYDGGGQFEERLSGQILVGSEPVAGPDIQRLTVYSGKSLTNSIPDWHPYFHGMGVDGTGLTKVVVTLPGTASSVTLTNMGNGHFENRISGYANLAALQAVRPTGDYVFSFNDGQDNLTVNFNTAEPGGSSHITNPVHGQATVAASPVFQWDSCAGLGDLLHIWLAPFGPPDPSQEPPLPTLSDITTTSWTAGEALTPSAQYTFRVVVVRHAQNLSAHTALGDLVDNGTTCDFVYDNKINFETAPTTDVTDGLRARWAFAEGIGTVAYDCAGGAPTRNGTVLGGGARYVSGRTGTTGMTFDGVDDYVDVTGTSDWNLQAGFTLTAWVKFSDNNSDVGILNKYIPGVAGGFFLGIQNNGFDFGLDANPRLRTAEAYNNGLWHHAAGVYDGVNGILSLYVDGILKRSTHQSYSVVNTANVRLGGFFQGSSNGAFKGVLDDVRVYDRPLAGDEVAQLAGASTAVLHGTVLLADYHNDPDVPVAVKVELRQGGQQVLLAKPVLDDAGGFTLGNVALGTYDVAIKAYGHLQSVRSVNINTATCDLGTITLASGDLNGDNEVTSTDLSLVLKNLDTVSVP